MEYEHNILIYMGVFMFGFERTVSRRYYFYPFHLNKKGLEIS